MRTEPMLIKRFSARARAINEATHKGTGRKAFAGALVVALVGVLLVGGTVAAFTSSTSNDNNQVSAGSVSITDNDSGGTLFSLSGLKPGDTTTACIKVTYTGSVASTVRLYGTTTGTGLDQYTSLQITRGTYSSPEPSFSSCTNFNADNTTYISGQAAGVIYAGTLGGFPTSWATGLVDPYSTAPETWTTNEPHVYKLQVTLGDNATAVSKDASQTFTWEAQNQ
jgi:predicted ribosomally synthesized peptide with SipW-like signal peptide